MPFTGTEYDDYYEVVSGLTFSVSTFCPNPAAALGTVTTQLQAALDAVAASGGTLTFPAGETYNINATLALTGGSTSATAIQDFVIDGNDSTIRFGGTGAGSVLALRRCKNAHIKDITFDGNFSRTKSESSNHNLMFFECNSPQIGGGRISLENVTSINSPASDCFCFRGADSNGVDPTRHSQNFLMHQCHGSNYYRNAVTINNCHNLQILGGSYSDTASTAVAPMSGIDFEPNDIPTSGPAVSDILIRGVTFSANRGKGVHMAGNKGGPRGIEDFTIEGNYFEDGATNTDATSQASGVHCIGTRGLIQKNLFENFTRTNQNSIICFAGAICNDSLIFDNSCNNISTNQPVYRALGTAGTGNEINGNRAFNHNGALVQNGDGAGCTVTGNTTTGSATTPSPVPPWDVSFDEPTFPGGAIEFDAVSSTGADFTANANWQHIPVGTPKGVLVLIAQSGGSGADQVLGVTYGGAGVTRVTNGFAQDVATEVGAAYAYHLGSSIPTGERTVAVTLVAVPAGTFRAYCITVTADGDTEVHASGIVEGDQANPTIGLTTSTGLECFVAGALFSGRAAADLAPGGDYTQIGEHEISALRTLSFVRRTSDSTGGVVNVDWVAASDDVAGVAVAISSVESTPEIIVLPLGLSRTRALGTAVVVLITSSVSLSIQALPARTRSLGTPVLNIQNGPVVVVPTGVTRTFRGLGSPNVVVTTPPLVTVIVQGLARTRALGTSVVVVIEDNATVTPTGLSRAFRGIGAAVVVSTGTAINATVNVQGLVRIRGLGEPLVNLVTDVVVPVGYTVFTDEQMADRLLPGGAGALDPGVVRNSLMTLRDRVSHLTPIAGGPSYISLTADQMSVLLMDNTTSTVDSFVLRSVILSLRDRLTGDPPLDAQDNTYRILDNTEMETLLYDSTHGYIDAYVLRSAILTLRDRIALVLDEE